jgi:lipopolysaccharide export LptBFGC system permease protein LptF
MGLLQRYILKELSGPLAMGIVVFTFVFLVGQLFQLSHLLLGSGAAGFLALQLVACLVPGVLVLTAPMGLLVATLLGVGRLAADREILAMRACGVHPFRLLMPVLIAGLALTGVFLWCSQTVVPALNLRAADLALQLEFRILSSLPANRPMPLSGMGDGRQQATFFFEEREETTGDMLGVTLRLVVPGKESEEARQRIRAIDRELASLVGNNSKEAETSTALLRIEKERLVRLQRGMEALTVAARGGMIPDLSARMIVLTLTSGTIQLVQSDRPEEPWNIRFDTLQKGFRPQFDQTAKGEFRKRPREMSLDELTQRMAGTGSRANSARVEFWQRFSVPMACLVMPLFAFPLGLAIRPQGKTIAFAVAFAVILIYYGLLNFGISVGRSGSDWVGLAMMTPNIILGLAGAFLAWRVMGK